MSYSVSVPDAVLSDIRDKLREAAKDLNYSDDVFGMIRRVSDEVGYSIEGVYGPEDHNHYTVVISGHVKTGEGDRMPEFFSIQVTRVYPKPVEAEEPDVAEDEKAARDMAAVAQSPAAV